MAESVDAFGDSDDEADYTKMDQGWSKPFILLSNHILLVNP